MTIKESLLNSSLDKSNMKLAIAQFPDQISKSFDIMKSWSPQKIYKDINNILIIGMGGSAIGGDVARVIAQNDCSLPIFVNRSYNIPDWVGSNTLVIASSYSGNTEETLSAFNQCKQKQASIIVITTGGEIENYANQYQLDRILVPAGYQPRAALGFSFTLILYLLNKLGFIPDDIIDKIYNIIKPLISMSVKMQENDNEALKIAEKIYTTCPIIYGSEDLTWVAALRFRGQLAENSKMLAFHHNFPEQNHNEIEGWTCNQSIMNNMSIIWMHDTSDHSGVKSRMNISSKLLDLKAGLQINIKQDGINKIHRLIKLIHFTDWISYYAALLNNVDPTPVNRIKELKLKISEEK